MIMEKNVKKLASVNVKMLLNHIEKEKCVKSKALDMS